MSVEKKNPLKRDQALNDATSGQMGEEPRSEPATTRIRFTKYGFKGKRLA
ncbi:MAG: hypothetical protein WAZ77_13035 [Candidatus Nitrosopolaris sp.]|jgi:hypothetical protein